MPTRYRVEITAAAQRDAAAIRDRIARDKPRAAAKWVRDFARHARSLKTHPLRYEVIPEAGELGVTIRHVIFGNYRLFYRVADDRVLILRVIHAARLLEPRLLEEP